MRIKGLYTETEAVYAAGNAGRQLVCRQIINAAFKGQLAVLCQLGYAMDFLQNSVNLLRTEYRGCAAAKENCLQLLLRKNSLLL